jgi:hypothetical protein
MRLWMSLVLRIGKGKGIVREKVKIERDGDGSEWAGALARYIRMTRAISICKWSCFWSRQTMISSISLE